MKTSQFQTKVQDIPSMFFVVCVSLMTHAEAIKFSDNCTMYDVRRCYFGDVLVVTPKANKHIDYRHMEMYCQCNLQQTGAVCLICKYKGETHCGHLTFKPYPRR